MELYYTHTNESLRAIVAGLALTEEDRVLSVGGSGDQAFAILEFAGKVTVVDHNRSQLDYIKLRKKFLENGELLKFLEVQKFGSCDGLLLGVSPEDRASMNVLVRNIYFRSNGRLEKIKEKLANLEIKEPGDIEDVIRDEMEFNKYYLSNTGIFYTKPNLLKKFKFNNIIYLTHRGAPSTYLGCALEKELTMLARKFEKEDTNYWEPIVLRKIQ